MNGTDKIIIPDDDSDLDFIDEQVREREERKTFTRLVITVPKRT